MGESGWERSVRRVWTKWPAAVSTVGVERDATDIYDYADRGGECPHHGLAPETHGGKRKLGRCDKTCRRYSRFDSFSHLPRKAFPWTVFQVFHPTRLRNNAEAWDTSALIFQQAILAPMKKRWPCEQMYASLS